MGNKAFVGLRLSRTLGVLVLIGCVLQLAVLPRGQEPVPVQSDNQAHHDQQQQQHVIEPQADPIPVQVEPLPNAQHQPPPQPIHDHHHEQPVPINLEDTQHQQPPPANFHPSLAEQAPPVVLHHRGAPLHSPSYDRQPPLPTPAPRRPEPPSHPQNQQEQEQQPDQPHYGGGAPSRAPERRRRTLQNPPNLYEVDDHGYRRMNGRIWDEAHQHPQEVDEHGQQVHEEPDSGAYEVHYGHHNSPHDPHDGHSGRRHHSHQRYHYSAGVGENAQNEEFRRREKALHHQGPEDPEEADYLKHQMEDEDEGDDIVDEWSDHMDDFIPDMLVTFRLPARSDEYFYQEVGPEPVLIRGGYFEAAESDDNSKIGFSVLDASGQVAINRTKSEGLFHFFTKVSGVYAFVLSNHNWIGEKFVTFVVGSGNETTLSVEHVNSVSSNVMVVARMIKDIHAESQYLWKRQKSQMESVQSAHSKVFWMSILEFLVIVIMAGVQVYYIKGLVSDKRVF